MPEEPQTVPDDRPIVEQDRSSMPREREQLTVPARAYEAPTPAQQQKPPSKIFSNLNLNGPVPARVRPNIGEWGPTDLPTTKHKKRWRWLVPVLFVIAIIVVAVVGYIFWRMYR